MRILSVCETAMGGVGIYQNYLARLQGPDMQIHVLAPDQHRSFLDDGLSLSVFNRPARNFRALSDLIRQFLILRRTLQPDLYFFHSTFALLPLLALRLSGDRTPALYCAHGWAAGTCRAGSFRHRMVTWIERRLCRLADHVVNVSQNEQDMAQAHDYHPHMSVIENAVPDSAPPASGDPAATLPPNRDPGAIHLLFVGRFDHQKGLDLLLPAFEQARRLRPDLRLYLVGGAVRGKGADLVIPDDVHQAGWVAPAQLDSWFSFADAVIVPSRWEGLPLVIPEALRNGTPVLCARRSGMQHLITAGQTGADFPLKVEAIAQALTALDAQDLAAMRPACRLAYETRYSLDRWQRQIRQVIGDMPMKGHAR